MNRNLDNIPEIFLKNTKKETSNNFDVYISSSNSDVKVENNNEKEVIWILLTFMVLFDVL